eukprot:1154350-Pelagomonas_calceolata.AAC.2
MMQESLDSRQIEWRFADEWNVISEGEREVGVSMHGPSAPLCVCARACVCELQVCGLWVTQKAASMVPPALAGKAQAMGGRDPETRKKRTADSLYLPTRLVYLRQKGTVPW